MQQTEQQSQQQSKRLGGTSGKGFMPGRSGNRLGRMSNAAQRAAVEAKARELAIEFGGFESLSVVKRELLIQAAQLLLRRPKTSEDVVRHANAVTKILRAIGLKPGNKPAASYVPMRDRIGRASP
jgi:hypothetical protein